MQCKAHTFFMSATLQPVEQVSMPLPLQQIFALIVCLVNVVYVYRFCVPLIRFDIATHHVLILS